MPIARKMTLPVWVCATVVLAAAGATQAAAAVLHPTVSLQAGTIGFYAGHLVLDGRGGAVFDDGVVRVHADRIIVDLRTNHYIAAGTVTVQGQNAAKGDALGMDMMTHHGIIVDTSGTPQSQAIDRGVVSGLAQSSPDEDPLAIPAIAYERPYALGSRAVAHLGADVRLANARIVVPGGESIPLPSYVYTFSSDNGYATTNISTGGEDLPIYYGSTPTSIQGIHFFYTPVSKLGIGLDDHIVFGDRGYDLLSASPIFGPTKSFNFTWQHHINNHASQTFFSATTTGSGTFNGYDVRDSVHRSFLELIASQGRGAYGSTAAWQSFDQRLGARAASTVYFHLRSEYGVTHVPGQSFSFSPFPAGAVLPTSVYHTLFEGFLGTLALNVGPNASIGASSDLRSEADILPHRQVSQTYALTSDQRWNRNVSTGFSANETPFFDSYPSVDTIYHSRISQQSFHVYYDHGDPFSLFVNLTRSTARSDNPSPPFVFPWILSANVRFRVTPSLALQFSRDYFFGFNGQRFGTLGFQIFP